ncbi:hypothetical protein EC988_001938 [Linderina pennispora]|nr:hypothetical protein EC988_001938 [Linderina pennispora]
MSNIPSMDNMISFNHKSMFLGRTIAGGAFEKWINSGPCGGLLKGFLDALVEDHSKAWSFQSVRAWSSSSRAQRVYKDGFVSAYTPPASSDSSGKSHTAFTHLVSGYSATKPSDIPHFCEAWGVLHFGLLGSHYGFGNTFARMEYTRLLLSVQTIALSVAASSGQVPGLPAACSTLASAIVSGLAQAQYTTTLVANTAHLTLRGSSLDGPHRTLGPRAADLAPSVAGHSPLSWAIRFASNDHGSIAIPDSNTEGKLICAVAHLMETPCVLANTRDDLKQEGVSFIIASPFA